MRHLSHLLAGCDSHIRSVCSCLADFGRHEIDSPKIKKLLGELMPLVVNV